MTEQVTPEQIQRPARTLEARDLFFAAINGLFIGILAPFIFHNISAVLPVSRTIFAIALTILCVLGITVGYGLSRFSPKLGFFFQLAKFGLIGVTNFVVDLGIFSLFIWATSIVEGSSIILFNIISVSVAIINSYIWNKFWSFEEKSLDETIVRKQFFQFIAVSVAGLILNTIVTYTLNEMGNGFGIEKTTWAIISKASASVVVLVWNFLGYKFFVFKR
jgi:putative flippase GtrA